MRIKNTHKKTPLVIGKLCIYPGATAMIKKETWDKYKKGAAGAIYAENYITVVTETQKVAAKKVNSKIGRKETAKKTVVTPESKQTDIDLDEAMGLKQ